MSRGARSVPLDALRGFALCGIIIVNAPFFAQPLWAEPVVAHWGDAAALWFTHAFTTGKFFLIFSFLFGFGFAAMLDRANAEGTSARGRFLRRLFGLFIFGMLHAVFLFFGDILMLYAVLGLVLWTCRNWPPRRLLGAAGCVLVVAIFCQAAALLGAAADTRPAPPPLAGEGYLGGFLVGAAHRLSELPADLDRLVPALLAEAFGSD